MNNPAGGWIKLHRKLRENPIYSNSTAVHCWIECLLRAIHTDNAVYILRQKVELSPGEFCMGREEFGKSIGVSGSTAWFWLRRFKLDSMIDIKTSSVGTIVTVLKWKDYQLLDSEVDRGKTADEQPMNTYKNDKKVKNDKKDNIIDNVLATKVANLNEFMDLFKGVNPNYERLFANKTQRGALERMILKYGEVKMRNMLTQLPSIVCKPYAPQISTPVELENKLGKLVQFMSQEKLKVSKTGTTKI